MTAGPEHTARQASARDDAARLPCLTTAEPSDEVVRSPCAEHANRQLDAGGTMWRLRSLVAMGHDASRLARALRLRPNTIRDLLCGRTPTVTPELWDLAGQLWDAWWDKRPPERTQAERRAATKARHQAERHGWCAPLGLDEEYLDEPGYRPYSGYRSAIGTGIAGDFRPAASRAKTKEIA